MTAPTATTSTPATTTPATCQPWCVEHDHYEGNPGCRSDWFPTVPFPADVCVKRNGDDIDIWISVQADHWYDIKEARALAAALNAAADLAETGTSTLDPIPGSWTAPASGGTTWGPHATNRPGDIQAQALGYRDFDDWSEQCYDDWFAASRA